MIFRPKKSVTRIEIRLPRAEELDAKIEQSGIEELEYDGRYQSYRLSLVSHDIAKNRPLLLELMRAAYQIRST